MNKETKKTTISLIGKDGNIFNLISLCNKTAKKDKWSTEQIKKFNDEINLAKSYDNALKIITDYFDVE